MCVLKGGGSVREIVVRFYFSIEFFFSFRNVLRIVDVVVVVLTASFKRQAKIKTFFVKCKPYGFLRGGHFRIGKNSHSC